jgi:hypothetical protein
MSKRTEEIKAFTLARINGEWIAKQLKIVKNPEMSYTECVCLGYTNIPIRGNFKTADVKCVTNENGVPILVHGEEGDRVLFVPEFVEGVKQIGKVELKKPFHTIYGYKIYNYNVKGVKEKVENEQVQETV